MIPLNELKDLPQSPRKRPRAFIAALCGPPQPVDKLKFAVVNDAGKIVSAVWTVFPAHNPKKPDIYVTASGLSSSAKFSFHRNILRHSFLSQAHPNLVAQGIVPEGSRHQQELPIPGLPWHGLTLRLVPDFLRKEGHSSDDYRGTIVALPVPKEGTVLEVGFILAEGSALNVRGAQAIIGEVGTGGRALVIALSFRPLDAEAHKAEINKLIAHVPIPQDKAPSLEAAKDDLAMMLYGEERVS